MLVYMIIKMVESKKSQGYSTTINEFWLKAKEWLPKLSVLSPVSQSSFCEARSKLDPAIFKEINRSLVSDSTKDKFLWHGHRIFAIDGSKINVPRSLSKNGFILSNPQSHYPQGLVSCLYDLKAKVPLDFALSADRNERACAFEHLEHLSAGDIVIYDRGYHGYGLLHQHVKTGIHTVMRMETTTTFSVVKDFAQSSSTDKIVSFIPAIGSLPKLRRSYPNLVPIEIKLRLIKYKVKNETYVLATTLLDKKKYPRKIFSDVYHSRWGIEEMYKTLKSVLGTIDFHGKSLKNVEQEIFAGFLLITISRLLANTAKVPERAGKKKYFLK